MADTDDLGENSTDIPYSLPRTCDWCVNALNGVSWGKQKRKKKFTFFFPTVFLSEQYKQMELSRSICFSNTNSTYTYLCLLSAVPSQGTCIHCQEYGSDLGKRLSSNGNCLSSKNPFSLTTSGARIISFESCIWYVRPVLFCYKQIVPSRARAALSRNRFTRCWYPTEEPRGRKDLG